MEMIVKMKSSARHRKSGEGFSTTCVHGGEMVDSLNGSVTTPIFQSATFLYPYAIDEHGNYTDRAAPYFYTRLSNPTVRVAERKLSLLEGTEDCVAFSSGMAAISTAVMEVVGRNGHILSVRDLYGGTHSLFEHVLPGMGHEVTLFDRNEAASLETMIRGNTRAVYVETPTNPTLSMYDIEEIFRTAHRNGLVTMIDNTFPSPVNMQPASFGADIVIHSATKYLGGHSDIIAGMVAGSTEITARIRNMQSVLGGSMDPFAAFLLERGMKTLELRVKKQNENATAIAEYLQDRRDISRVLYPGLKTHEGHAIASRIMKGYGGMLSFDIKAGGKAAERFIRRLKIAKVAASLGGVETLVTIPAVTSHRQLSAAELRKRGIAQGLVRLSAGIENADDLIEDISAALG